MALYARMGIPAYFLYDPDRRYLPSPLMGFRLVDGAYVEISPNADGRYPFRNIRVGFRIYWTMVSASTIHRQSSGCKPEQRKLKQKSNASKQKLHT